MDEASPASERTLDELKREHGFHVGARHGLPKGEIAEQSPVRNYVRDLVLGYNDGLVSVYAATAGVAGAAFAPHDVLVVGIAVSIAGALSMAAGEYISTKSQAQFYDAERKREKEHLRKWPHLEEQELRESLAERGLPPHLVDEVTKSIKSDPEKFLDYMMREEFGVGKESERSPWAASGLIMVAFLLGAVLAVIPYALLGTQDALIGSTVLSLVGLFTAGAVRGRVSRLSAFRAGLEMLVIGLLAGAITYGVGRLFGVIA